MKVKNLLKTLIVDDEKPARDELNFLLSSEAEIAVIGEADSALGAIDLAAALKPDVIFLDVQMRGMNGLETAAVLRKVSPDTLIVFASAYDEYAIKAFELGVLDYLLKPFEQERVHATVSRLVKHHFDDWQAAVKKLDETLKTKIVLSKLPVIDKGVIMLVPYREIIYAFAQSGGVTVVTENGRYEYDGTLAEMQERLKNTSFMRVHKSYIVNMEKVRQVIPWFKGTYWLKVEGIDTEIPVSKGQIKEIKDILGLK
jgi:two-component system LytT family response regulator/two-component system response regulator LytT